jgi:hypothetical protein
LTDTRREPTERIAPRTHSGSWQTHALDTTSDKHPAECMPEYWVSIHDEVAHAKQEAVDRVGQVASNLQHPRFVRLVNNPGNLDATTDQVGHEQHVVADQPCERHQRAMRARTRDSNSRSSSGSGAHANVPSRDRWSGLDRSRAVACTDTTHGSARVVPATSSDRRSDRHAAKRRAPTGRRRPPPLVCRSRAVLPAPSPGFVLSGAQRAPGPRRCCWPIR